MTSSAPAPPELAPLEVPDDELASWSDRRPLAMRFAQAWAAYSPRGKGAVPRWVGRTFGKRWKATIRSGDGARFAVYPPQLDVFAYIARVGSWNEEISVACVALLQPGQVFYDIGANAGHITQTVAGRRPDVKVFAFEPQPYLARCVAVSARLNRLSNVQVFSTLLGRTDGSAELFVPAHGIHASVTLVRDHAKPLTCPMWRLDTILERQWAPAPDVIKIDVEGAEDQVFAGAETLLRTRPPTILFEAYPGSQVKLKTLLRQYADFQFFGQTPDGFKPTPPDTEDAGYTDLLAVPPGRHINGIGAGVSS